MLRDVLEEDDRHRGCEAGGDLGLNGLRYLEPSQDPLAIAFQGALLDRVVAKVEAKAFRSSAIPRFGCSRKPGGPRREAFGRSEGVTADGRRLGR